MTAEVRKSDRGTDIRLAGPWDPLDPVEVKKTLTALPQAETMVVIDVSALEDLPLGLVQVLLAYTRYARSQPRPVRPRARRCWM